MAFRHSDHVYAESESAKPASDEKDPLGAGITIGLFVLLMIGLILVYFLYFMKINKLYVRRWVPKGDGIDVPALSIPFPAKGPVGGPHTAHTTKVTEAPKEDYGANRSSTSVAKPVPIEEKIHQSTSSSGIRLPKNAKE